MRQSYQIRKPPVPKFSNIAKPLQERKNVKQNDYSRLTSSNKKITLGAKINDLSKSSVSHFSSSYSRVLNTNLSLSRISLQNSRIYPTQNRASYRRLDGKSQIIDSNVQNLIPPLSSLHKTHSILVQDQKNFQSLSQTVQPSPTLLQQSIVIKRIDQIISPSECKIKSLTVELQQKQSQILNLKNQLHSTKLKHEEQLRMITSKNESLSKSIEELNIIIFDLRNAQQYQKQIIAILEERQSNLVLNNKHNQQQNEKLKKQLENLLFEYKNDNNKQQLQRTHQLSHKIIQMQKGISEQNTLLKNLRNDLIEKQAKINKLQQFIEQANQIAINENLERLNQLMIQQEKSQQDQQQQKQYEQREYLNKQELPQNIN